MGLKMKVLLMSPFMDPESVGEPKWCFELASEISKILDTTIITLTPQNRSFTISQVIPEATVFETKSWQTFKIHPRLDALVKPNYLNFMSFCKKTIRDQLDLSSYQCAHQFGPLAMRYPSVLRHFPIPYIMGPIGGCLQYPHTFKPQSTNQPWYYKLREFDSLRLRHDPFLRKTYSSASIVVGVADYVQSVLEDIKLQKFVVCPEIAAKIPQTANLMGSNAAKRPEILTVGRLIYSKGVSFGLQAMASVAKTTRDWHWNIVGDGPEKGALEQACRELGLADQVTFHGHVSRQTVDTYYDRSDILLFPSIREPSGSVIFEAMSKSLPIVTANYGGPGSHTKETFGFRASVGSKQEFVDGLAHGVLNLLQNSELRQEMSRASFQCAQNEHRIEQRAAFFKNLYSQFD